MTSKAAKQRQRTSKAHADRTKYAATPKRSGGGAGVKRESRLNLGCGMAFGALLHLAVAVLGTSLVLSSTWDLTDQLGLRGRPVLHMRIDACLDRGVGKNMYTDCYGYGNPGKSRVTGEMWMIDNADDHYAPGTVLSVRCTPTGGCERTGFGPAAGDIAGLAVGLLLVGAVLGAAIVALRMFLGRGPLARRWIRAAIWSGSPLAATAVVSGIIYLAV